MRDAQAITPPLTDTSCRILLIEDNPGDARLFEEYLREGISEIDLQWTEDLASGLDALAEQSPDVVVLDLGLPDSDGIDTVRRCIEAAPSVPVVVLTGDRTLDTALAAQQAGAAEYLQKGELSPSLVERTLRWAQERTRMESEIRQRKARFQGLANSIPGIVFQFEVHPDGTQRFSFVSDRTEEILGISSDPDDFFERVLERTPPDYRQPLFTSIEEAVEAEATWRHEGPFVKPSGEEIWTLGTSSPVRQENKLVFNGVLLDITERKEEELQRRILAEAVDQAKEAVLVTEAEPLDAPGPRIVYVNEACEAMTGYAEEEMLGQTPRLMQGPHTDREVLDSLRDALDAGEEWEGETVNYREDGSPYRVQWNVAPVTGEEGRIEYWVSVQRNVTEQREREERLTQLARALEEVDDKVVITDREGQIQYVNRAFEDITGYAEEEVIGQTPAVLRSGQHDEDFYEELWGTIRSGNAFRTEFTNERKDGTTYVEDQSISPIADEEGHITHFVSSGRDITEQKQREKELHRSQERYQSLFEDASDAILVHDLQGRIQEVNPRAEALFGFDAETLVGRSVQDLHTPGEEETAQEKLGVLRAGDTFRAVSRYERSDGSAFWGEVSADATRIAGETVVRSMIRDVTERREVERKLRESEERFRGMFENAAIGIAILDEEGRIVEANPTLLEMMGYTSEELRGAHFEQISHPDDLDSDQSNFDELIAGSRDRYQLQKRYVRKEGEVFWGRLTVSRLDEGREARAVGMVEDIDEQKRYEEHLREAKEEAERMNRLKSAFLANMSHEIRTPLTSIIGFAEVIGDQVDTAEEDGEVPHFTRLIEKSGRRLMETLTGVLNLSKLEAGEMKFASKPVDLTEEIRDMIEHFQPQFERGGIDLQADLGEEPVWAQGDTEGLRLTLRNLISNALKYTEPGGWVRVRAAQTDAAVILEVEDDGIGMDSSEVSALFEAFAQASNGFGREYEGTGLGLAVTKQAVEGMGGSIEVETEKGEGSCFIVRLPRAEGEMVEEESP